MSLLMEALRKAEQEKATKRTAGPEAPEGAPAATADDLAVATNAGNAAPPASPAHPPAATAAAPPRTLDALTTADLQLEPVTPDGDAPDNLLNDAGDAMAARPLPGLDAAADATAADAGGDSLEKTQGHDASGGMADSMRGDDTRQPASKAMTGTMARTMVGALAESQAEDQHESGAGLRTLTGRQGAGATINIQTRPAPARPAQVDGQGDGQGDGQNDGRGDALRDDAGPRSNPALRPRSGAASGPAAAAASKESLPGVTARQLVKDIGQADVLTPVAAETVFSAASARRAGRPRYGLYGGLAAVLLLAAGAVVYLFVLALRPQSGGAPPLAASSSDRASDRAIALAQGITPVTEFTQVGPPPGQAATEIDDAAMPDAPQSGAMTTANQPDEAAAMPDVVADTLVNEAMDETVPAQPAPADDAALSDAGPAAAESPNINPPNAESLNPTPSDSEFRNSESPHPRSPNAAPPLAGQGAPAQPPISPPAEVTPSYLQISKAKAVEQDERAVQQAYLAYQRGRLAEAKRRYQALLQAWPDNRDALLGLAAVAIKQADTATATAIYEHLLALDAGDSLARTALIGLQGPQPAGASESDVKTLLFAEPDNPYLHFTLGQIYAVGARWPAAQQSFFEAYRLDSANPGYALNLAISLDHLGQAEAALDYYHVALALVAQQNITRENIAQENTAKGEDTVIDAAAVRQRIRALSARRQP